MSNHPSIDVFIDPVFEPVYRDFPVVLADVGARGGLKSNWAAARRHLRVLGFEPEKKEFDRLVERSASGRATRFFNAALHNRRGPIELFVARDRGLSSIFEPDRAFLDAFPDADRFDTVKRDQVAADTLDAVLGDNGVTDVDFIKADTQGSELFVLEGASKTLAASVFGVEVEVEFTPIYKGQPLFADVDRYLRGLGYLLFDLRPCYWKRAAGRAIGGPRGQIIWADALYLRSIAALETAVAPLDPERRKSKILRSLSIAMLYGYYDYALQMAEELGRAFPPAERATIERRLRQHGASDGPAFPGRRIASAVFHRLWKLSRHRDRNAWSVSAAKLGNLN